MTQIQEIDLIRENAELRERVEELEKRLCELGVAFTILTTVAMEAARA